MVLKGVLAEDLQIGDHDNVVCYVKSGPVAGSVLTGEFGTIQLKVKQKSRNSVSGKVIVTESEEERLKEECYNELCILALIFLFDFLINFQIYFIQSKINESTHFFQFFTRQCP